MLKGSKTTKLRTIKTPNLVRRMCNSYMVSMESNLRCDNIRSVYQINKYLSHVPINKWGGVIYTLDRHGMLVYTDLEIVRTDWYRQHQDHIMNSWINSNEELIPVLPMITTSNGTGHPDRVIYERENQEIWDTIKDAVHDGMTVNRVTMQTGVNEFRIRAIFKKFLTTA